MGVWRPAGQVVRAAALDLMTTHQEQDAVVLGWVRELQAGSAVEENSRRIFVRYFPWVRGFFGRRGLAPQETEDLAQDTLFQVLREIGQFGERSSLDAWVFAIAANAWRNELRRRGTSKRRGQEVSLDSEDRDQESGRALEVAGEEPTPERAVFEQQRKRALRAAVEGLPPQMRRVLLLRLDRELKYREIATLLKLNLETVKAHLFQARDRLREALGEEFGEWQD